MLRHDCPSLKIPLPNPLPLARERGFPGPDIAGDAGAMTAVGAGEAAGRHQGRRYYGWYVVAACNVVAVMTWGIGVFNQGVFLAYFVDRYGWPRSALSFGPLLFYVWAGVAGVMIGRLI